MDPVTRTEEPNKPVNPLWVYANLTVNFAEASPKLSFLG